MGGLKNERRASERVFRLVDRIRGPINHGYRSTEAGPISAGALLAPIPPVTALLLLGSLALIVTLPLIDWFPTISWHDQQRVGQIAALTIAFVAIAIGHIHGITMPLVDRSTRRSIAVVIAWGILSAVAAHRPSWAIVEVCLATGTLGLGWAVAVTRRKLGADVDRALLAAVFLVSAALAAQFVVRYVSALTNDVLLLDVWLLLDGFSNPRFYGQFLTFVLPVLAAPLLTKGYLARFAGPAAVLLVLIWTIAIASGTRATWLGMVAAAAWLACTGKAGRRWVQWQIATAMTGAVLCWVMTGLLPQLFGIQTANSAARLTANLSMRDVIWWQAIEMIQNRPVLGYGPMHFADIPNPIAAHPHQAWLQWASEWGVPSALIVTWLVARSAQAVFRLLRAERLSMAQPHVLRLCLAGAIAAALGHSMVDGVLVMPYSQLWLALIGGWLLGLHPHDFSCRKPAFPWRTSWGVLLAIAMSTLVSVVTRDYPHLFEYEQLYSSAVGGRLQPRFWGQGVIGQMPGQ